MLVATAFGASIVLIQRFFKHPWPFH